MLHRLIAAAVWLLVPFIAEARPNVVLFVVDTLRAAQVHCLGYPRRTTDSLDALAARGTIFTNAIAPSGWSLPSFSALFTSVPAPAHGNQDANRVLDSSFQTVADIFSVHGYRTAGFVAGGHVGRAFGLAKGFQVYYDQPNFGSFFHTVPEALHWLQGDEDPRPFFLVVHGYDCHAPYNAPLGIAEMYDPSYRGVVHDLRLLEDPLQSRIQGNVFRALAPESPPGSAPGGLFERIRRWFAPEPSEPPPIPLTQADTAHFVAHYDAAVTYADSWLGVFLENLDRLGRSRQTIVVVAADHGEELGEHGRFGHRHVLSNSIIHVPLVIAGPGIARGRRVTDVVEMIDVAPTLLEMAGIPPCTAHQGRSLAAHVSESGPAPSDSERVAYSYRARAMSARTRRWHLTMDDTGVALYDLAADPIELQNVAEREKQVTARLTSLLRDWEERYRRDTLTGTAVLGEQERALFRRRGYW